MWADFEEDAKIYSADNPASRARWLIDLEAITKRTGRDKIAEVYAQMVREGYKIKSVEDWEMERGGVSERGN